MDIAHLPYGRLDRVVEHSRPPLAILTERLTQALGLSTGRALGLHGA